MTARLRHPSGSRWIVLAVFFVANAVHSRDQPVAPEAQVKAAYLHKFSDFVEWPADSFAAPASPVVIGVAGADEVYGELGRLAATRLVQGRRVEVRRVAPPLPASPVHVLYIGPESRREAAVLLTHVAGRPVLTVTDWSTGLGAGAVLNLVQLDGRIRFEASLPAAAANRLKLSSRLLGVATRVVEKAP